MHALLMLLALSAGPAQAFPEPPSGPCPLCMLGEWHVTAEYPDHGLTCWCSVRLLPGGMIRGGWNDGEVGSWMLKGGTLRLHLHGSWSEVYTLRHRWGVWHGLGDYTDDPEITTTEPIRDARVRVTFSRPGREP